MSDVRGVRAFKCDRRPLPPDGAAGAFDGDRRQRADLSTTPASRSRRRQREQPDFYSADHLQLNHYYTRSEAELAAKIGRGPNLPAKSREYERKVRRTVANIEADEVEDRAALDYLARIGWEARAAAELIVATYENPRALALCLASVARQAARPDSSPSPTTGRGRRPRRWSRRSRRGAPGLGAPRLARGRGLPEERDPQPGDRHVGGGLPGLHRRRRAACGRTSSPGTWSWPGPDRWCSGSLIRLDAEATAAVTEALVASGPGVRPRLAPRAPGDRPVRHLAEDPAAAGAGARGARPGDAGAEGLGRGELLGLPGGAARGQRLRREHEVRRRGQGARRAADQQRRARPAPALHRLGRPSRPSARLCRPRR